MLSRCDQTMLIQMATSTVAPAATPGSPEALPMELARALGDPLRWQIVELEALDASGWQRTGRHGEHGELSVELYETHVAAEEVDHLAQIARLL